MMMMMMMSEEEHELLPPEIEIEIMKRLPVKSLLKFMSVSKSWKSVIRSSPFITDYNRTHIQPADHQLFVAYYYGRVDIFINDDDDDDDDDNDGFRLLQHHSDHTPSVLTDFHLIGYSQGLFGYKDYEDRLGIFNPSIRKTVFIPFPEQMSRYLGYDFGFTVVCNATTKPMYTIFNYNKRGLEVQICTLSAGAWRTVSNTPPRASLIITDAWVAIDRFIYWIAYDTTPYNPLILSFDITSEQFTELCLPFTLPHTQPSSFRLRLSKHEESMVMLQTDESEKEFGVWMMMMEPGVQNSFTKLYTVKLFTYPELFHGVLGFRKNGHPIISVGYPEILFTYEPRVKCFKSTRIYGHGLVVAGSYMETLLLLDD